MQTPDGWNEHNGGPCPVSPLSRPAIKFRNGRVKTSGVWEADFWRGINGEDDWWHWRLRSPQERDIIAYQRENPDAQ